MTQSSQQPPEGIYPWLADQLQQLAQQHQGGRLHHALLFTGPSGLGKQQLAQRLAERILCSAPNHGMACGRCKHCRLHQAGHHPDCHQIVPEAEKQQLGIDRIRQLQDKLNDKGLTNTQRVVVIPHSEQMTEAAANALLKTLEEPGNGVFFLLTCDALSRLPATVVSRCRLVKIPRPEVASTLPWLQQQTGVCIEPAQLALYDYSPLRAAREIGAGQLAQASEQMDLFLQLLADAPVWPELASRIADEAITTIDWMQLALVDLCRLEYQQASPLIFPALKARYQPLLARDAAEFHQLYRRLATLKHQLQSSPGLNKTLQLQSVLLVRDHITGDNGECS